MLSDKNLIFNASVTGSVNGSAFELGRGSISRNAQLTVIVPTADAAQTITCTLKLSLDNGTLYSYPAGTVFVPANYKGQWSVPVSVPDFVWEEYASANIQCRLEITASGAGTWGTVKAYLGEGEPTIAGRRATADTLQT